MDREGTVELGRLRQIGQAPPASDRDVATELQDGLIQTLIIFDGSLDSWWIRIVIGGLLFLFIVLQKGIMRAVSALSQAEG